MNRVTSTLTTLLSCLAACAIEAPDAADTLDTETIEQAVTVRMACIVSDTVGKVATSDSCRGTLTQADGLIGAAIEGSTSSLPADRRRFVWKLNGAPITNNTPALYSPVDPNVIGADVSCRSDSPGCFVLAKRSCFNERRFTFQVLIYDKTRPSSQPIDTGTIVATLQPTLCPNTACVIPPTPVMTVQSDLCFGAHSKSWPAVPEAHVYQVQAKPLMPNRDWSQIPVTPGFPGLIVDAPFLDCPGSVPSASAARIRACNDCGCSPWGPDTLISYVRTCN